MRRQHSTRPTSITTPHGDLADRPFAPPLIVQRKLTVGAINDPAEAEADRVAEAVMSPAPAEQVTITAAPAVQRSAATDVAMTPTVESDIGRARGSGTHLPGQIAQRMGTAMGANFAQVRIHANTQADTLNRSLNARAFTTGSDIFFRQGEYQPGSSAGQKLLAHELTHVVQQGATQTVAQRTSNVVQREGDKKGVADPLHDIKMKAKSPAALISLHDAGQIYSGKLAFQNKNAKNKEDFTSGYELSVKGHPPAGGYYPRRIVHFHFSDKNYTKIERGHFKDSHSAADHNHVIITRADEAKILGICKAYVG